MLEFNQLQKRFGEVTALDRLSFAVQPGRILGFLGPNGAGKTTAMRCVLGLVNPDAGTVTWQGSEIDGTTRLRFGYMPEERGLYPKMLVGEQIAYFARLSGLERKQAAAAANRWLTRFGLTDRSSSKVEELSHGNQQRVQLACALVHEPEVAVLDEPFAGLDPIGMETMATELRQLATQGMTILFSSHQLDLVAGVCQDVVIIDSGCTVLSGEMGTLQTASPTRFLEIDVAGLPWTTEIRRRLNFALQEVVQQNSEKDDRKKDDDIRSGW